MDLDFACMNEVLISDVSDVWDESVGFDQKRECVNCVWLAAIALSRFKCHPLSTWETWPRLTSVVCISGMPSWVLRPFLSKVEKALSVQFAEKLAPSHRFDRGLMMLQRIAGVLETSERYFRPLVYAACITMLNNVQDLAI